MQAARSRRFRTVVAAAVVGVIAGAFALGGATSASAATTGHWGTFSVSGAARQYTGSMSLAGFPATDFTSTSRQATVISGQSVWQGPSTPPGAQDGSSRGDTYLNQRPSADNGNSGSAASTVYRFATPTPIGGWSFVLGDIDADQATITATGTDGSPVAVADLGYSGSYNSCSSVSAGGWSCGRPTTDDPTPGSDTPTWDGATGTLVGNAAASDTAGASAWFSPRVALSSLTITYQQRSGLPVYQTWFADRTAAISGTADLDGTPLPGVVVTATDASGTVYRTTTDASGAYSFPDLVRTTAAYTVAVDGPPGADGATTRSVALTDGDGSADFPFRTPTGSTAIIGTVTTTIGEDQVPAADVPVSVVTPDGTTDTTTNAAGVYVVSDLPANTDVTVAVPGLPPTTVTTGAAGGAPAAVPVIAVPAEAVDLAVVSGTAVLDDAAYAGAALTLTDASGTVVATATTAADGSYTFPAVPSGDYTVTIAQPVGSDGASTSPVTAVAGADTPVDFAFTTPPAVVTTSATGTLTNADGTPSAGAEITATATPDDVVTTVTGDDGTFTLDGLTPSTPYTLTVDGQTVATITTPASGSTALGTLALPAVGGGTGGGGTGTGGGTGGGGGGTGTGTGGGTSTGTGGSTVSDPGFGGGALAYTGSNPAPALIGAGILVLMGVVFLLARVMRGRRDHHLED